MKSGKEKMFFATFLLSVLLSDSDACFTSNQVEFNKIKTGSSFYQECRCDDPSSGVKLKWLDINNQEILPLRPGTKSNVFSEWMDKQTYSVYISNISKSISGAYKCVTDRDGRQYTLTYNVEAYDPPYFVNTKETQYVVSGKAALITCEARGEADLLISWHKEDEGLIEITDDDKYKITPEGLIINAITKEDSGAYRCTASDLETGEGIDRDIYVEVISTPSIVELAASPNATVALGESLTIECSATGIPHPEYGWKKILDNNSTETNVTWQQVNSRIVFQEVEAEDRGTYECTARNSAGSHVMTINIEVLLPPNITEFNNVTAVEGSTAQLICKATGRPLPHIALTFLGEESDDQSIVWDNKNLNDTEAEFYLSFLRVNRSHDGIYLCNATNEIDSVVEETYLSVLFAPHFDLSYERAWTWKDKNINLSCEHRSNPKAEVTWKYQGNGILVEDQLEINKVMSDKLHSDPLIIENKTWYGIYECTAKNEFGEAKKIIHLQEGFTPAVINNVSIINVTSNSVTFSIEEPNGFNGPDIIGFKSEYDEVDNYNITDIHINRTWSKDRPFRLDRLKANTSYNIKFAAINDVGNGPWSEIFDFVTLEKIDSRSVPDEPVWEDDVVQLIASDRVLKWKPADSSDTVEFYAIKYCPTYDGLIEENLCEEEQIGLTDEFQLHKMDANTTYFFEIVAGNSVGNSSAALIMVTIPAEEESFLSSGAIIGIAILVVFLCLVTLDVLLLLWRQQGIIASCCYKKKNKREVSLNSRDKKGLLKDNTETNETLKRPSNGHKEYEYNKTTGVITGKHSAV
ncbi:fasciclin-2-like [Vanessa cardui]|uniref:fasciclin-2-like n=1 Tax=Vanessa cardui TaxID=171605 RepID=UPI001F12A27D|nr:fasciclin-2-like [Vanessa cardui]